MNPGLSNGRRVLVAGATGWLGRHVIDAVENAGMEPLGLARPGSGDGRTVACDVADSRAVAALVGNGEARAIINCVRTGPADAEGGVVLESLLRAATNRHVRVVHVGSAAEYGDAGRFGRLAERRKPRPLTVYGHAKADATAAALAARADGWDVVVGRVFNLIGPGESERTVAGAWAGRIGRAEVRDGDVVDVAPAVRDFVDVRDAARALVVLALASLRYPLYNICSGRGIRIDQLVRRMLRIAGVAARVRTIRESSKGALGLVRSVGSPTRIRSLGWRPAIPIGQSCRDLLIEHVRSRT